MQRHKLGAKWLLSEDLLEFQYLHIITSLVTRNKRENSNNYCNKPSLKTKLISTGEVKIKKGKRS